MASGMAVITTKVGGVEDFINNGENGIICERDIVKFAEQLEKLILDKSLRTSLGEKAKFAVSQQFDYRRLVSDVNELYKRLLKI
jgi:glycosyltransferase involved in cell wall biosynthesis